MSDSLEDFLAHYGVPGMKWGVRKRHQYSVATKEGKARRDKIEAARGRINSGKNARILKEAKAQYKVDKLSEGKAQAKKTLNKAKLKNLKDIQLSNTAIDGKEFTTALLLDVASFGGVSVGNYAVNRSVKKLEKKTR